MTTIIRINTAADLARAEERIAELAGALEGTQEEAELAATIFAVEIWLARQLPSDVLLVTGAEPMKPRGGKLSPTTAAQNFAKAIGWLRSGANRVAGMVRSLVTA
jgi:hypothetical protein